MSQKFNYIKRTEAVSIDFCKYAAPAGLLSHTHQAKNFFK
ncbi:Uncharacterized protein dnm_087130 [Desulfonema magnum]|uniref:Uncharacterized protein n=1 Tax=Desulfonema magnum TaxID=45655 RepID=A0A975BVQ0_9BACT|nr:Uncharacterized protein dnm_087130 [Desulfonema magnum]